MAGPHVPIERIAIGWRLNNKRIADVIAGVEPEIR